MTWSQNIQKSGEFISSLFFCSAQKNSLFYGGERDVSRIFHSFYYLCQERRPFHGQKFQAGERFSGQAHREAENTLPGLYGFQDGPAPGYSRFTRSLRKEMGLPGMQEVCESQEAAEPGLLR